MLLLIVNGILGMRLWALYGRNFNVLCFLAVIFLGEVGVNIYTISKFGSSIAKNAFVPTPGTPVLGCLTDPKLAVGVDFGWSYSIVVAVIFFFMTFVKFSQSALEARRSGWRIRFPPLAMAFFRDGTVYFLAVVVTLIAGAASSSLVQGPLVVLYEPWMAASLVVAGSRLVLNLREAAFCDCSTYHDSIFNSVLRRLETLPSE
jgi:hypothetical protein